MCTYNFSFSDSAVNRIRPAFKDDAAVQAWMQRQLEIAISLFNVPEPEVGESMDLSSDVAWFKNHPVVLTADDIDERAKYILER